MWGEKIKFTRPRGGKIITAVSSLLKELSRRERRALVGKGKYQEWWIYEQMKAEEQWREGNREKTRVWGDR